MTGTRYKCRFAVTAFLGLAAVATGAQLPLSHAPARSIVKPADVEYLYPEQVTLPAGKPDNLTLHFRVAPGLHINSHAPKENFLIPTTFSIPEDSGVRLENADYPPGGEFVEPFDPNEKLSVYTGEFAIDTRIVASPGDHLVQAKLHYQACTNNTCLPPKTMTVAIDVVGK
jgi:Disulphide bond corrector protein DsbC